jgi:type I restriction enzyme S subunit
MITDLKPYAEYKESGLPWLGQVPGHWEVERTKWRFRHLKVLNTASDSTNVLSLTLRGVVNNNPDDPEGLVPKDYRTYQLFAAGDLVFKLIDLENLRTSRVGLVHEDGIMSSAYVRLVPSKPVNRYYFYHQFFDLYSRGVYNQLGAGVRSTLGPTDLLNIAIAFPPANEQAAIVRFLDWANGRLERAIRAKRKVIALLNEQKQAIIHRAVTRGLDPSVPLKDSGVSWLGEIPAHWEVVRSRRLFTARKELARPNDVQLSATQAYGVIPQDEFERRVGRRVVKISMHLDKRKHVERDDFVMSMRSFQGGIERAWAEGAIRSSYVILRPSESVVVDFFTLVLKSRGYIGALQCTADFIRDGQDLTEANFREVDLPLPPPTEQAQIAEYIDRATSRLTYDASRLDREIDLLREYRTRLVADVVTGKLDVRAAAAALPNEATLDDATASPDPDDALDTDDLSDSEADA